MPNDILIVWKNLQSGPYQWDIDEGIPENVWFCEVAAQLKGVSEDLEPFEIPFSTFNDAYQFHKMLYDTMEPIEINLGDHCGGDNVTYYEAYEH